MQRSLEDNKKNLGTTIQTFAILSQQNKGYSGTFKFRCGSRINTDRFPILGRSGGMLPRVMFWILTPQSPLSWVSEPFRQDIYWLSKPFSRFQLGRFKVFTKNISIMKYLTDFRKTVETGMDPRPKLHNIYKRFTMTVVSDLKKVISK